MVSLVRDPIQDEDAKRSASERASQAPSTRGQALASWESDRVARRTFLGWPRWPLCHLMPGFPCRPLLLQVGEIVVSRFPVVLPMSGRLPKIGKSLSEIVSFLVAHEWEVLDLLHNRHVFKVEGIRSDPGEMTDASVRCLDVRLTAAVASEVCPQDFEAIGLTALRRSHHACQTLPAFDWASPRCPSVTPSRRCRTLGPHDFRNARLKRIGPCDSCGCPESGRNAEVAECSRS